MRPKPSLCLFGVLLWILCTHSLSDASILVTAPSYIPPVDASVQETIRVLLHDAKTKNILDILSKEAKHSVEFATEVVDKLGHLETNLAWSNIHVMKDGPAHGQLIESQADMEGLGQVKNAIIAGKASQHLINLECQNIASNDKQKCAKYLTQLSMVGTNLYPFCHHLSKKCSDDMNSKYRTIDGTCNHIQNGTLGRSFTGYRRLLFPSYYDGIGEVRKGANRRPLPSARVLSTKLNKNLDKKDDSITLALMQWTQFISHDLARTASSKMLFSNLSVMCCDNYFNNLAPRYIHPFCMPISIPGDDAFYSRYRVNCMTYVRSLPAFNTDCTFGPLDQMNQVTHYLDGSQIYGSTYSKSEELREKTGGKLKDSNDGKKLLPSAMNPENDCQIKTPNSECYKAGDVRVNMQPHLTAMHVLWNREHNRLAKKLQGLNPGWDDEKIFQEARKIVIAEIQHITYNEWAPVVLGKSLIKKIHTNEYHENIDARISNAFATAAMKFVNSLMDNFLKIYDENRNTSHFIRLHEHFNRPDILEKPGNLDGLIRGLATQPCQKFDLEVVSDVTQKLYAHRDPLGFDAFSLDIQRGRDHGLPGYVKYREICNLPAVRNFNDLSDFIPMEIISVLQKIYSSPEDIDLLVGGLAERPLHDSLLGPTFRCIIAEQLERTRMGDRFFYTHLKEPWSFTNDQLKQIKEVTLATIFCENGDDIRKMQEDVFMKIDKNNQLKQCSEIPQLDLSYWKA